MPPLPDHLDPKEATEARLCAYLEGELSPEERGDIEKHLKVNPQHRQLLIDLAETREWMRTVPKEVAPPELAEALALQMERSMLLDDHHETGGAAINRLPQYALLAAIVLLMLGLGAVIMVILRGGQNYSIGKSVGESLTTSQSTTAPIVEETPSTAAKPVDAINGELIKKEAASSPVVVAAAGRGESGGEALALRQAATAAPVVAPKVFDDRSDLAQVESVIRDHTASSDRRTIGLVVSSPNPAATADQVRGFFTSQQVVFDNEQPSKCESNDGKFSLALANANTPALNRAFGVGGGGRNLAGQNDQESPQQSPGNGNAIANAVQQPNIIKAIASTQSSPMLANADGSSTPDELVYIGHGLTPLQLELLHGTLVTGGIDQTVKRLDLSQATVTGKVAILTGTADALMISKGQVLTITVPQLVGPGIEKTNVVKVTDDGTINLPMLDPLPATGTSPTDLQDRIATKYKEANLIPAATVTVTVNAPATQPATQPTVVMAIPSTSPATSQPIALAEATSQPTADDKVDVVVYVRKAK